MSGVYEGEKLLQYDPHLQGEVEVSKESLSGHGKLSCIIHVLPAMLYIHVPLTAASIIHVHV